MHLVDSKILTSEENFSDWIRVVGTWIIDIGVKEYSNREKKPEP